MSKGCVDQVRASYQVSAPLLLQSCWCSHSSSADRTKNLQKITRLLCIPSASLGCWQSHLYCKHTSPSAETQGSTEEEIRNRNNTCNILSFKKQTRASPALTTRSWQWPACVAQTDYHWKQTGTQTAICTAAAADTNYTCSYMSNNYLFI